VAIFNRTFVTLSLAAPLLVGGSLFLMIPGCSKESSTNSDSVQAQPSSTTDMDAAVLDSSVPNGSGSSWKFVMVGDTHVTATAAPLPDLVPAIAAENPSLVLVAGDIVQTGKGTTPSEMQQQLAMFHVVMEPLYAKGIPVYPVRGNHENDAFGSAEAWKASFTGNRSLPGNGPAGEEGLSYSFTFKNSLFVAVDEYVTIHQANQPWLDSLLTANTLPHVFVFGHEPAFKYFHTDCMDDVVDARNTFWKSLTKSGAKVYLCGHDHFRDLSRIDDGDGHVDNDLYQYIVGTGGGPFPPAAGIQNGENAPYTPVSVSHEVQNGFLLVEIHGETAQDRDVTMTFKRRSCATGTSDCSYEPSDDVFHYTAPQKTP
jgi:predicted MPP superfamily phosphohydrolase